MLQRVEVAACHTGLAIEGPVRAIVDCAFVFCVNGSEVRSGAAGSVHLARTSFHACSHGDPRRSGRAARSGDVGRRRGYRFAAGRSTWSHPLAASAWSRSPICSCPAISTSMSESGRVTSRRCAAAASMLPASGAASGSSCSRPARRSWRLALIVENTRADVTGVAPVLLSGGTNLDLLAPGDLIVLAGDARRHRRALDGPQGDARGRGARGGQPDDRQRRDRAGERGAPAPPAVRRCHQGGRSRPAPRRSTASAPARPRRPSSGCAPTTTAGSSPPTIRCPPIRSIWSAATPSCGIFPALPASRSRSPGSSYGKEPSTAR